ncbi:MAG: hypothetical protein V4556_01685 [Bacteroidota bacterium]
MSDNWQHRIFEHEEKPPANAWENIARELDAIEKDKSTPVLTVVKNKRIIYLRIAAAACIAGIIFSGIWFYTSDKKGTSSTDINTSLAGKQIPSVPSAPSVSPSKPNEDIKVANENISAVSKMPISKKKIVTKPTEEEETVTELQYANVEKVDPLATDPILNKEKLIGTSGEQINDISLMTSPNSYVSIIGPNGQEVKVSSKFSNLLGYINGSAVQEEENLDKIINESNFWKSKFKSWREKMINNNVSPSPSNFMDIIDLSKLLEENK